MERHRSPSTASTASDGQEPDSRSGGVPQKGKPRELEQTGQTRAAPQEASEALHAAVKAAGLEVSSAELPRLIKQLGGRTAVPEEGLRRALLDIRRRAWRERLAELASRAKALPVGPMDLDLAVTAIEKLSVGDAELLAALREAVIVRLGGYDTPRAALAAALEDLPKGTPGEATQEAVEQCAFLVAEAFALSPTDAAAFARRSVDTERRRRGERREASRIARETHAEEARRLETWEASLVPADSVPFLLGCTREEAERWTHAGIVPVARRVVLRRGGRTVREPEFDPAVLKTLREEVPAWRQADRKTRPVETRMKPQGGGGKSNAAIARAAGLDRYAAHFATARALNRQIVACLGPTNSGKTYFGLSRLAEAESGIILGPLRLLAHEYREALEGRGIPTALLTGEERIAVQGSRHTAATVEMCPFSTPVDVAVIDEAQMLADPERGAAWTAAIMGVPARRVIVLGAPDAAPMLRRIASLCGDPLEEVRLERMGPLKAAHEPVPLGDIGPGDAVIAFSRREVFALRTELLRRGRSVAVVYGALGPTVRRAEARRFREGRAEVLVATDAIGMGLNIGPLRRVVFSALRKYDGQQERPLSAGEIKQIGGRAGRFGGEHAEGIVAVLAGGGEPAAIEAALAASWTLPQDLRPPVAPDADIVAAVAAEIGTDSLFGALSRIERSVLRRDDPNYRLGDLSTQIAIAGAVDGVRELSLLDRWTYAMCPVDERDEGISRVTDWAVEHAMGRAVAPPRAGRLSTPDRASQEALQLAERVHRRLVAWRWMAQRFPEVYRDLDGAMAESRRLNEWIEAVLSAQPSERMLRIADGNDVAGAVEQKGRTGRGGRPRSSQYEAGRQPRRRPGPAPSP